MANRRSLRKEHALGPTQSHAFRAVAQGRPRGLWRVGLGVHAHAAHLVGPGHQLRELVDRARGDDVERARVDVAGRAIEGQQVPFSQRFGGPAPSRRTVRSCEVDLESTAAHDATFPESAGDDRRVRGHPAGRGDDALGGLHAVDVLGAGFLADQDDLLPFGDPPDGVVGVEHDAARSRAGACG